MPIYEYRCRSCGYVSEFIMGVTGGDLSPTCRKCGSVEVERMISAAAIASHSRAPGCTCCGREERCATPPCSSGGTCER